MIEGWPIPGGEGKITSLYGWRRRIFQTRGLIFENGVVKEFHHGIDLSADPGTSIIALAPGTVIMAEELDKYGNTVVIDHGFNYETLSAHLSEIKVKEGDKVERGQVIGIIGDSGLTTGVHLHLEVRLGNTTLDPMNYLTKGEEEQE